LGLLIHLGIQMCTTVSGVKASKTTDGNNEAAISNLFEKMAKMQDQIDSLKSSEKSLKQSIKSLTEANKQLKTRIQLLENMRVSPEMIVSRAPTVPDDDDSHDTGAVNTSSEVGAKILRVNETPSPRG